MVVKLTGSLQFPPGAPPHFSRVICIKPCSPPPPTVSGLQLLSCMAKDASMIGATPNWLPYCSNMLMYLLQALNGLEGDWSALERGWVITSFIWMLGGCQPAEVSKPQLSQSIFPLGPDSLVICATDVCQKITHDGDSRPTHPLHRWDHS
jgi:hypothetical protein